MFSKAILGYILTASFALQAYAHAGFSPALGVSGTLQRSDVRRPNNDCGGGDVSKIDAASPATIDTNFQVQVTVQNFNGGGDGSRSVKTALINTDGGGKKFSPANVTVNGNANPNANSAETLTIQLPPNTQCTGGNNKNRCLLSLTTTAGFGNCVVLQSNNANTASTASTASNNAINPALIGCNPASGPLTNVTRSLATNIKPRREESGAPVRRSRLFRRHLP